MIERHPAVVNHNKRARKENGRKNFSNGGKDNEYAKNSLEGHVGYKSNVNLTKQTKEIKEAMEK